MGTEMGSSLFSLCCMILLLLKATQCLSIAQTLSRFDECSALLQFKETFTINKSASGDPFAYPKVESWKRARDQNRTDCCSWDGVDCDENSGRVIGLDLSSSCLYGSITSNSSLFRLAHLQMLDLSGNNFNHSQIPSRLGRDLTSLTYLNLSDSAFSGQIPLEISQLSKLSILDLSYQSDNSSPLKLTDAKLRSLVRNMTYIKQLHLSWVDISSTVPEILVNASSLISLELGSCGLSGEFPVGIFHLPKLEVLSLFNNSDLNGHLPNFNTSNSFMKLVLRETNFSGNLPTSLGNLRSLNKLDLYHCNFYPYLPPSLSNLTELTYLDLLSFYLENNFSASQLDSYSWSWVGNLTNLFHLGLDQVRLGPEFPYFLANLTQMEFLSLVNTGITGEIPSWLSKLTKLTSLDLKKNNLRGGFPRSIFQLQNLEHLDLSLNELSGPAEFDFSNFKNLRNLRLSNNKLSLKLKTDLNATVPQLQILELGSCNLTEFPLFLNTQHELQDLQLFNNNIHGQVPKWLWSISTQTLLVLDFYGNFLTGFEQNPSIVPWPNMLYFDIWNNKFQGLLPIPPQSIQVYNVGYNGYSGEVPPSFCNLNDLHSLDLSNNNFSGKLPQCLGNSSVIEQLMLSNNSFWGDIPPLCSNKNMMTQIDLSYNKFKGKIPRSMANCMQLEFMNIGNNQISDIFPSWLGALPLLWALILRSNGFHGTIGKPATNNEFPKLSIIDLSNNDFSGTLPSKYLETWNSMKFLDENKSTYHDIRSSINSSNFSMSYTSWVPINTFAKGVELKYQQTPNLLKLIDLSGNRFEGEIPAGVIGNLRGLIQLNLSNNALTGPIPSSLGNLTALESLDLSNNQLSGKIPSSLTQLNFLAYFNVSHNRLLGLIPLGKQFSTFLGDSYIGNSGLCGMPLLKKCGDSESSRPPPPSSFREEDEDMSLDWYVVLPGVVSGLFVGVVAGNTVADKTHQWFVEKFSRRRQPRGITRKTGLRRT